MKKAIFILLVAVLAITVAFTGLSCKATKEETTTAAGEVSTEGGVLNILCFNGYADDAWVKPFEEKYKCKVNVTYAGTVEEHFTKTKAAPKEYNLISIDPGRVNMYFDAGLIQPIDVSKLSNYTKIGKLFQNPDYADPQKKGEVYHVPFCWGEDTFAINMDKVTMEQLKPFYTEFANKPGEGSLTLKIMAAPDFAGQLSMFDEATNVTTLAALSIGVKDIFNFTEDDYKNVEAELKTWAKNCRLFTTGLDSESQALMNEDVNIAILGQNAQDSLIFEKAGKAGKFKQFQFTEGSHCWFDGWVITKASEGASLDLAHKYIDWMIGDEVQKQVANLVGFGIVNPAGAAGYAEILKKEQWWYVGSIDDFPVPLFIMRKEEDPERRVNLWNQIKSQL